MFVLKIFFLLYQRIRYFQSQFDSYFMEPSFNAYVLLQLTGLIHEAKPVHIIATRSVVRRLSMIN